MTGFAALADHRRSSAWKVGILSGKPSEDAHSSTRRKGGFRCSFDIGGTFTDFILIDDRTNEIRIHKSLTVPSDPARGAIEGLGELLRQADVELGDLTQVIHGSTLVTNLVIERKGAATALITTKGFRDIIEYGTEQRYDVHDLFLKFPEPLVSRALRIEVDERISRDGDVLVPLNLEQVHRALAQAVAQGARAVAVVFLHSYRNASHERAVADYARSHFPELYVSISSEVCGEIREYERATTTTANAYAQPIVDPYIAKLDRDLRAGGFDGQLFLVQSSGALASPEMARRLPIRLLESGPAGGGLAAAHFGRTLGKDNVIAFDMGGTTAKVCLIQGGRPDIAPMMEAAREQRFRRGSGLPIRAPVIDMIEIGAGGGSIAHHDELGLLKVGPRSAGAAPGPAAYARGGTKPTVTDANLLLGYLGTDSFLGGRMRLDRDAAEQAFRPLALEDGDIYRAAWGVYAVVCENMAGAARVHIVEKGRDPRNFAMIAFGGAGPAHAVRIAKALNVSEVIIPRASGAASALGFLGAALAHEAVRSAPCLVSEMETKETESLLAELEQEGRTLLATAEMDPASITVRREVEVRLSGQVHALRVDAPRDMQAGGAMEELARNFAAAYRDLYAREPVGGELEVISWRVTCAAPSMKLDLGNMSSVSPAPRTRRMAWFPEADGLVETDVYSRYALQPGVRIAGPAIIEENESTTVVPPGDTFELDSGGNIIISLGTVAQRRDRSVVRATGEIDPIDLEIMWSRLITISEECWQAVIRTAFSLIISEAQDFACEILDANGDSLAHSPRAMPVFNITLMTAAKFLLEEYPIDTLRPGDVLMTNDPWRGSGHLFDVAVLTPVFHQDKVVAFIGTIGHVSDIGGTKNKSAVREVYEEGIQLPPVKLYDQGRPNKDVFRILHANLRNSRQVVGDIEALIAANALGAERLADFMEEYGFNDLTLLAATMHSLSEKAAREAIGTLPSGVYEAITHFNGGGQRLNVPARITIGADAIEVDFEGCPPQVAVGGINNTLPPSQARALFALKCILTPAIRATAGCYRPFTVKAPENSLLNCSYPAAVGLRRLTLFYVDAPIFRALSAAAPNRVQAFTGLAVIVDLHGRDASGRTFTDYLFVGGGQGGSSVQDGKTGMLWPTSAANTSIEMIESRIPVVVLEKSTVADSAGAGEHRGGFGQRIRLQRLYDDGYPVFINVYPEGPDVTTDGMDAGEPGGTSKAFLHTGATTREIMSPTMLDIKSRGEIVEVIIGGGAGFGDPLQRDRSLVENDIHNGYITANGALRYGYEARQEDGVSSLG